METLSPRPPTARTLALILATTLGPLACTDDLVEVPEVLPGKPTCMIVIGSYGQYADGTKRLVTNRAERRSPAGCTCVPPEDRWEPETLAQLNELALADCLANAAKFDFVWDTCEDDYEAGAWLESVSTIDEDSPFMPDDLYCSGE